MTAGSSSRVEAGAPARRHAEAGFTLLELVIATAVLLLAVLLACDLLDESGRVLHHSVRRARDPWPLLAAELLRNDLRGTQPPAGAMGSDLLRLYTADGEVVWQRNANGRLSRRVDGGPRRVYLQDVRGFRWYRHSGNTVEVWVRYHVSSPYLRQLAGSLPKPDPGENHELHLLVVGRGGGWTQAW